jgi:arylsulfatase A-like enzyme
LGFLGGLLGRRDRVYSLSLLVPLTVYNLALKAYDIASRPGNYGLARTLNLMRSDIFFNLGHTLVWTGLFAAARGGPLRWAVVVVFHIATMLVGLVRTCAHQYFQQTGTTLDYDIIALWLPRFDEIKPMLKIPLLTRILLFVAIFYAALGPWFVTRAVGRWRGGWPRRSPEYRPRISLLGSLGLCLQGLGLGSLSLLIGSSAAGASKSFARDPFVNLILTGAKEAITGEDDPNVGADGRDAERPDTSSKIVPTSRTQKRNVVLIHLESTRAESVTPYNEDLKTTPFLDELAKHSLLAERYYTTVPHTSKASVSVNCGIDPRLIQPVTEANPGGVPVPCLASLLKKQGYSSVFFQSSVKNFENFDGLVNNFGYDEYYPLESLDTEGFERSNYFGYEDDIMLKPSEQWLEKHKDEPFVAEYLMGTGHHDYRCVPNRYGTEDFSDDDLVNTYDNCLRYQDFFVKNLIEQYKELGLYENTIFVLYGDHGEGFGEHGRYQHDDVTWEEGLRVPLIIHAPGWFENGERVKELSNHTDILPTVLEMLGYEVKDGEYPGYSLLHSLPEDRTLMFSCFHERMCLASIKGTGKYIYHYDNLPEEFFDLSNDPLEQQSLADERGKEELDKRREDLFAWRSNVDATYRGK